MDTTPTSLEAAPPASPFLPSDDLVPLALSAFGAANADLVEVIADPLFVVARDPHPARVVGVVSGGGSGHEPLHAGFVGRGGLDAAVPGRVFASPHNRQVYAASRRVARGGGVLHIVKNYTGDVINFGIAAERLADDGIPTARVLVDDDVATDDADAATGRRGTVATLVVEKIVGARADDGATLEELRALGQRIADSSRSIAVAARPLTSFTTRRPAFDLDHGSLEYGVGIHGERAKTTVAAPALEHLVERMIGDLLDAGSQEHQRVILVVNGLGATTQLELHAVSAIATAALAHRGVRLDSVAVGSFVTALDMGGFSLTVTETDDEVTALWLRASRTPGLPTTSNFTPAAGDDAPPAPRVSTANVYLDRLEARVHAAHALLTALDGASGDGDFGDNLAVGVSRARSTVLGADRASAIAALASAFLDDVGGSSGPLLGLLLSQLRDGDLFEREDQAAAERFRDAAARGMAAVSRVGGAARGDRTLVDALAAVADEDPATVEELISAAAAGARATAAMRARRGRASYVGDRAQGLPDPGAVGTVILLAEIASWIDGSADHDPGAAADRLLEEIAGAVPH